MPITAPGLDTFLGGQVETEEEKRRRMLMEMGIDPDSLPPDPTAIPPADVPMVDIPLDTSTGAGPSPLETTAGAPSFPYNMEQVTEDPEERAQRMGIREAGTEPLRRRTPTTGAAPYPTGQVSLNDVFGPYQGTGSITPPRVAIGDTEIPGVGGLMHLAERLPGTMGPMAVGAAGRGGTIANLAAGLLGEPITPGDVLAQGGRTLGRAGRRIGEVEAGVARDIGVLNQPQTAAMGRPGRRAATPTPGPQGDSEYAAMLRQESPEVSAILDARSPGWATKDTDEINEIMETMAREAEESRAAAPMELSDEALGAVDSVATKAARTATPERLWNTMPKDDRYSILKANEDLQQYSNLRIGDIPNKKATEGPFKGQSPRDRIKAFMEDWSTGKGETAPSDEIEVRPPPPTEETPRQRETNMRNPAVMVTMPTDEYVSKRLDAMVEIAAINGAKLSRQQILDYSRAFKKQHEDTMRTAITGVEPEDIELAQQITEQTVKDSPELLQLWRERQSGLRAPRLGALDDTERFADPANEPVVSGLPSDAIGSRISGKNLRRQRGEATVEPAAPAPAEAPAATPIPSPEPPPVRAADIDPTARKVPISQLEARLRAVAPTIADTTIAQKAGKSPEVYRTLLEKAFSDAQGQRQRGDVPPINQGVEKQPRVKMRGEQVAAAVEADELSKAEAELAALRKQVEELQGKSGETPGQKAARARFVAEGEADVSEASAARRSAEAQVEAGLPKEGTAPTPPKPTEPATAPEAPKVEAEAPAEPGDPRRSQVLGAAARKIGIRLDTTAGRPMRFKGGPLGDRYRNIPVAKGEEMNRKNQWKNLESLLKTYGAEVPEQVVKAPSAPATPKVEKPAVEKKPPTPTGWSQSDAEKRLREEFGPGFRLSTEGQKGDATRRVNIVQKTDKGETIVGSATFTKGQGFEGVYTQAKKFLVDKKTPTVNGEVVRTPGAAPKAPEAEATPAKEAKAPRTPSSSNKLWREATPDQRKKWLPGVDSTKLWGALTTDERKAARKAMPKEAAEAKTPTTPPKATAPAATPTPSAATTNPLPDAFKEGNVLSEKNIKGDKDEPGYGHYLLSTFEPDKVKVEKKVKGQPRVVSYDGIKGTGGTLRKAFEDAVSKYKADPERKAEATAQAALVRDHGETPTATAGIKPGTKATAAVAQLSAKYPGWVITHKKQTNGTHIFNAKYGGTGDLVEGHKPGTSPYISANDLDIKLSGKVADGSAPPPPPPPGSPPSTPPSTPNPGSPGGPSPETRDVIKKIAVQMREAVAANPAQTEARRKELAKRFTEARKRTESSTDPNDAFAAGRSALYGQLPKITLTPLDVSEGEMRLVNGYLQDRIKAKKGQAIGDVLFTTANEANEALNQVVKGEVITKHQAEVIGRFFGSDIAEALAEIEDRSLNTGQRILRGVAVAYDIPRHFVSAGDLSFIFRQGLFLNFAHPKTAARVYKDMGQVFGSEMKRSSKKLARVAGRKFTEADEATYTQVVHDRITNDDYFQLHQEAGGFYADPFGRRTGQQEEQFTANSKLAKAMEDHLFVAPSQRAFITAGNDIRFSLSKQMYQQLEKSGVFFTPPSHKIKAGEPYTVDPDAYRDITAFFNYATGRGDIPPGQVATILGRTFFAPRLFTSRIQMLGMGLEAVAGVSLKGHKMNSQVRLEILKDLAWTFGVIGSVIGAAAALGVGTVETDPTSSDFAKIKIGDLHVDLWGGMQPLVRYASQIAGGKSRSIGTGEVMENDPLETLVRFGRSKLNIPGALAVDLYTGQTFVGKDLDTLEKRYSHVISNLVFFTAREFINTYNEYEGKAGLAAASAALQFIGIGTSVFTPDEDKIPGLYQFRTAEVQAAYIIANRLTSDEKDVKMIREDLVKYANARGKGDKDAAGKLAQKIEAAWKGVLQRTDSTFGAIVSGDDDEDTIFNTITRHIRNEAVRDHPELAIHLKEKGEKTEFEEPKKEKVAEIPEPKRAATPANPKLDPWPAAYLTDYLAGFYGPKWGYNNPHDDKGVAYNQLPVEARREIVNHIAKLDAKTVELYGKQGDKNFRTLSASRKATVSKAVGQPKTPVKEKSDTQKRSEEVEGILKEKPQDIDEMRRRVREVR